MSTTNSRSLPTSYTWSFPGSPVQIAVRLSVITDLQRVLDRQARPDTANLPLCGVLLGVPSRPGLTEISGFEALPSLRPEIVEKIRHQKSGIIGFYRTTENGSLRMSDEDIALAHAHFTEPGSVFLLIEADQAGPSNAVFFFWNEGELHGDLALMEFPFDAYQLALTEQRRSETLERLSPLAPERVGRVAPKSSYRRSAVLVSAALLVAGAIGASWYFVRGRNASAASPGQKAAAPAPAPPSLGLALDRHGSGLQLYWNRQAPPILNGSFGMVLIREGEKSRTIPLSQDQLRSGSILYEPTTDQVDMQLNVIAGDRVTRESITAILPPAGAAHPVISSAQIVEPVRQRVASRDEPDTVLDEPAQRELRKFSLPAASKTSTRAAAPSITEPPLVATAAGTGSPASLPAWSPFPLPSLPPSPSSPPRSPDLGEPAPAAQSLSSSAPAPAGQSPKPAAPDRPVATHQVIPRISSEMKLILMKPASVEILVKIDAHGKVTSAQAAGNQKVNSLLVQAALDAARSWTFRPAAIGGTPVPAEMILTFNFTPTH